MELPARFLIFHGAIVFLIGLLCGAPYGRAVNRSPAHVVNSWRVAHSGLTMGAMGMLAFGAALSHLIGAQGLKWMIAYSFAVSSYAFCVSLPLAALVGHRGLSAKGPWLAKIVFIGNIVGAAASLLAASMFAYLAYFTL